MQNEGTGSFQEEDVARMGMMLTQLAANTTGKKNKPPMVDVGANGHHGDGSIGAIETTAVSDRRRSRDAPPFQGQKLFEANTTAAGSKIVYGPRSTRLQPRQQQGRQMQHNIQQQHQQHQDIYASRNSEQEEKQWYSEERALLRELIVLTMRYSNGTLLRFVPSEEEQIQMWNTHGHPVSNRFAPNIVAEGVRINPKLIVLPEWSSSREEDEDGFVPAREDLEFRANLRMPLLGSGARDAIALCGECGWLYGRVASYVESVLEDDFDGVQCATARALAARMEKELAEYHRHLSLLESELPPLDLEKVSLPEAQGGAPSPQGATRYLTLRSLSARLIPIRDFLRTLAILADGVGAYNLRGGKLLATVLRHSLDGRTRHTDLVRSIAADCSVPWYNLLSRWITQGVLEDVHSEFFVKEIKPESLEKDMIMSSGFFTWHQRYVLVEGQIPLCSCGGLMDIITVDLAREVLLVGKGINFIRYCLQNRDWEVAEKDEEDNASGETDVVGESYNFATLMDVNDSDDELLYVSTLHNAVMKSSARIHSHILESLENQHHMMQHLLALKHFLFLGQGDFVSSFMESLNQEFHGRTSIAGIYSHTLSALLEGSLRSTTARFLPSFVLGNLRARLMSPDKNHDSNQYWMGPPPKSKEAEMVPWKANEASVQDPWDFIYLEYKIKSPLDAIVHTSAMETYHQVFLFLFRIKRVEWMLNNSWRQSTALNHAILIETKAGGADAPANSEAAEQASFLLRRISSTRQTMLHVISNLQNYLMFEVLEGGWEALVQSMGKARSLDDLIRAHDFYLNEIVDKALLSNEDDGQNSNGRHLEDLLRKLLSIALNFGKFQDHIFRNSLAGLDKAAKIRREVREKAEKGDYGRRTLDKEEGRVFQYLADTNLFEFVQHNANDFNGALSDLLKTMSKQIDEVNCNATMDDDQEEIVPVMRNNDALPFLLFRLDFSGYYARQARENRKKKKHNS